jgi:hypothetical protein
LGWSGRLRLLLALVLFAGGENRVQDRSFHARHELDNRDVADVLDQAIDDVVAKVAVSHLASAETEAGFDLVAALQELDCLILLGLVVVIVHGDGEFDFLDDDDLLLFARGAFGLVLLVEKAAVVLDAADGWDGGRRDFDQVESTFAGNLQRFKWREDAELFAVLVDYADFAGANAIVDADKRLSRAFIECDGTSSKWAGRPDPELVRSSCRTRERTLSIALV